MDHPHSLPEAIGPYRVTGRLGSGGMGEVLAGHDERLDRPVALKRILPDIQEREKAFQRFRREAQAVARLSHPSIVQVHDWEESDGDHWLVMEFVEGCSLHDEIARGALPPGRALEIAREVASGLAEAHDAGIVHRDLKAANVMLDVGGRAKILDFGLAKAVRLDSASETAVPAQLTTLTGEGRIIGTVTSMSPEQALGKAVDHRSDLFSLGILLYEMLTGIRPFVGSTPVATLTRLCSAREEPLHRHDASIPDGISRLVSRLLEKNPSRRPQDAHEVVREIDRLLGQLSDAEESDRAESNDDDSQELTRFEGPPIARSESDASSSAPTGAEATRAGVLRPSIRRLAFIAATVVVVVAVVALGFWFVWPSSPTPVSEAFGTRSPTRAAEPTPYELFQDGLALLERADSEELIERSIAQFQRALAIDQNFAPALAGIAMAYLQDHSIGTRDPQRVEQALAAAEHAVEMNEHLALAWISLGSVHLEMGRLNDAALEFERAMDLEPSNGLALSGLGRVFEARGDTERAEKLLRRAVELEPKEVQYLGMLLYRTGRYEEAAQAFSDYLELVPNRYRILRNLGVVYYMQGRLTEAAAEFQKALLIQPDSTLYSNIGTIYFVQGLYPRAASAFEQAIQNGGSNHAMLWGNLGDAHRWIRGQESESRDAYLRAIQLLRQNLQSEPQDLESRTRLALYLAKRGECDEASAEIEQLADLPVADGHAFFRLAVAHEVCGERESALDALGQSLRARFSIEEVRRDPELMKLRQDVRYHRMVMQLPSEDGS